MAKTGIKIQTADTVLGAPIDVDRNAMLIFTHETYSGVSGKFTSGSCYKLTSENDLKALGVDETNNPVVVSQVADFYHPLDNVDNTGTILWVGLETDSETEGTMLQLVASTVSSDFNERPRQIGIVLADSVMSSALHFGDDYYAEQVSKYSGYLEELASSYSIRAVGVINGILCKDGVSDNLDEYLASMPDMSTYGAPFLGVSVGSKQRLPDFSDEDRKNLDDGLVGTILGILSATSVGTSIGDGGLTPITKRMYLPLLETDSEGDPILQEFDELSLNSASLPTFETLGTKQYIFPRTRPPRNGLWFNDGATCNDADNALSSLEAGRTICSLADALQSFFVPYINTRVPVTSTGDIQSTYKQVVLDNARAAVVQRYLESGDISDARINLVAKDNDMIGTRTWEVTLSILPAPTLRWIDGYVFYVKSL